MLPTVFVPGSSRCRSTRCAAAARPAQRPGQLFESGEGLALVGQPARLLAPERVSRVARGEVHQLAPLAAARHSQVDLALTARLEKGDQLVRVGRQERHQDARRNRTRRGVVLLDERGQRLRVGRVAHVLEQEHVTCHDRALADGEQLHCRAAAGAGEAEDVDLRPREGGHLLRLHRALDGAQLVAHVGCRS